MTPENSEQAWAQAINEAPETVVQKPTTGQLTDVNEGDLESNGNTYKGFHGQSLWVVADPDKEYSSELKVSSSYDAKDCSIQFTNKDITSVYNYADLTESASARGMAMSFNQAKLLAQNTLHALGVTDMTFAGVQLATLIPLTASENPNTKNQAYGFWFTRNISGVMNTLDLNEARPEHNESYSYERIFMLVDDTGVIDFTRTSPMKVSGSVSANVKVLPFSDIMTTFKHQFFTQYAQSDPSKKGSTYTINRITLGMMRVQVKDQDNGYLLIPVWDFYGTKSPSSQPSSDYILKSFLTINALDGSTISRNLGY